MERSNVDQQAVNCSRGHDSRVVGMVGKAAGPTYIKIPTQMQRYHATNSPAS